MATIVFAGGHELKVREDASTVIGRIAVAAAGTEDLQLAFTDGAHMTVRGWFSVTDEHDVMLPARPGTVAYVRP